MKNISISDKSRNHSQMLDRRILHNKNISKTFLSLSSHAAFCYKLFFYSSFSAFGLESCNQIKSYNIVSCLNSSLIYETQPHLWKCIFAVCKAGKMLTYSREKCSSVTSAATIRHLLYKWHSHCIKQSVQLARDPASLGYGLWWIDPLIIFHFQSIINNILCDHPDTKN